MKQNALLNNTKWIMLCKAAQSLLQLVIGLLCARYLGPSNYGLIKYAKSVVAIVLPVMQLGMTSTLVQEFVKKPEKEGEILGTSLAMQLVSCLFCTLMVLAIVFLANPGETETIVVCMLYSLSMFFLAAETTQYWFHSKLMSKYPSIMLVIAYVAVSAYKVYLLVSGKNVYWFAIAESIEYGVIAVGLFVCYNKFKVAKLSVSFSMAKDLFSRSKYYIVASLMFVAFQNIDHIMLKNMIGDAENGFYSAAITSAVVVQFVYYAIIDSARPVILQCKKDSQEKYEKNLARLYCVIVYLALAQSFVFTILAKLIILFLYGRQYMASVPVLQILVWYLAFSYIGAIRNIWILAEEKHSRLWRINLCGVMANVVLNAMFIPRWGACGAAAASVITQFFTNVVVGFIMKDIRPNNRLMLKGLNPKLVLEMLYMLKDMLNKKKSLEA